MHNSRRSLYAQVLPPTFSRRLPKETEWSSRRSAAASSASRRCRRGSGALLRTGVSLLRGARQRVVTRPWRREERAAPRPPSHARGALERYEMMGCGSTAEAAWGVAASLDAGGWRRSHARPP